MKTTAKNLRVDKCEILVGGPSPPNLGQGPLTSGALVRDPKATPNAERTVALSAAVTEKIAIEKKNLTPSSGETGRGRGPKSRM